MKKLNIIIDCDVTSNVDDRFMIAYAIANSENLNIKAITIEPYKSQTKDISIEEMQMDSKFEARRILSLMNVKADDMIFEGSKSYFSNKSNETSDAVEKIAKLTSKSSSLTIIATGVLTNIAVLLQKHSELASKLNIVWLGTGNLLLDKFEDTNYASDKLAYEYVLKSGVNLTVIPSFVSRAVLSSVYEMEHNIASSIIGKYLVKCSKDFDEQGSEFGIVNLNDIVAVAYLVHPEFFKVKSLSVNELLKEQKPLKKPYQVSYVYDMEKGNVVWKDFIKKINFNEENPFVSEVFFISDTHFSQRRKISLRQVPFDSVEESDAEIVRRWNQKVSKNDIVYHLGDFGNYDKIKELNGKVILICGNYEKADYGKDKNFEEFREKLLKLGFAEVYKKGIYLDKDVLGEKVFLTHRPLTHARNCYSLFGHVHTLAPIKKFGFNVCLAYHNYAPISRKEAMRYLNFLKHGADRDVFA